MVRHGLGGFVVGIAHHHVDRIFRQVAGLHHGDAGRLQHAHGRGAVRHRVQDQAADPLGQEGADHPFLVLHIVRRLGQHQLQAARPQIVGDALDGLGEDRIFQAGQHQADHVGALRGQVPRHVIVHIAQAAHGLEHAVAQVFLDLVRLVEGARHRHARNASHLGDFAHTRRRVLTFRSWLGRHRFSPRRYAYRVEFMTLAGCAQV